MRIFRLQGKHEPVYTALSYTWGVDTCEHDIVLNGDVVRVRKNLHSFLLQMQAERRRDWFFVDALCINQEDAEERAHQVALMGKVYFGAEEVIAWMQRESYYMADDGELFYQDEDCAPAAVREDSLAITSEEKSLAAKKLMLHNSFWSRLWIVQEVLLAKRLTIRMRYATVDWFDLRPKRYAFDYTLAQYMQCFKEDFMPPVVSCSITVRSALL